MEFTNLLYEVNEQKIAFITINRPDKLNALSQGVMADIQQAIQLVKQDSVVGLIITGAGEKAFIAGADIAEFNGLDENQAKALAKRGQDIFFELEQLPIPVVAVVNGFALGGGCELSMACHIRVATTNAKFGQPEVNLGIIAGYGGTQRLTNYIGKARSMELHLTADMIDAGTALNWGLVNYVEQDKTAAIAKAITIITKAATKGPIAIAKAIACINAYYDKSKDGYAEEVTSFGAIFTTEDVKEGVNAFLEKRKPIFTGK